MKEQPMSDEKPMGQVIQIDEARIRDHLGEMVRGTVEETLNAMLDAEADQLCGAGRYERSQARQDTRAGSYDRTLQTSAGEVNLKIPKLRRQTFETAIIERLSPAGELGRGIPDRDVPGGDFGAQSRGHHRSPVGHAGEPEHGVEPQQEDLRQDRGLAEPADRR
jgi:Transposase and inactivated derivatives